MYRNFYFQLSNRIVERLSQIVGSLVSRKIVTLMKEIYNVDKDK